MDTTLKKLRVKFVAIIMAVVTVVLVASFATVVVVDYNRSMGEVYEALDDALMRDGSLGVSKGRPDISDSSLHGIDGLAAGKGQPDGDLHRFEIGDRGKAQSLIPVAVYELSGAGELTLVSGAASGALSEEALEAASSKIASLPDGHGFMDSIGVYYAKQSRSDTTLAAFADEASVSEWKSLALTLAGIGLLALVVFFAISLVFSKWALSPVKESWDRQKQFVADASHELKTPLTVMAADASILMRHPEKTVASQSQWLESMETEIESMQELVGDMLLLAGSDATGAQMHDGFECIDLSKAVNSLALQFDSLAYEKGIDLAVDVEGGIFVEGDQSKLRRLASTLLDNAFKYAGDDGNVSVRLTKEGGFARLAVNNPGAVIPEADLPHIFDRFYRADKSRGRDGSKSYGLGLAIASEIAKSQGGTLSAESSEGAGTTLTAMLPLSNDAC